jgi:hypothetical protein
MSLLLGTALALTVGCDKKSTEDEKPKTETEVKRQNAPAVTAIAEARCDRETRCENVGTDKKFANRQACMDQIRERSKDALNPKACPGGVDSKALGECLEEIRNEDCSSPLETVERMAACNTVDLCVVSTLTR